MKLLVVGSIALDSIETPFGKEVNILGGSASYFSLSASMFTDVCAVAVVGKDFPEEHLDLFRSKGIAIERSLQGLCWTEFPRFVSSPGSTKKV